MASRRLALPGHRFFTAIMATAGSLLLLAACDQRAAPAAEVLRPVRTQVLAPTHLNMIGIFPGEIRPHRESLLGFQVGGKLIERPARLGDAVKAGQLMARIDPEDLGLAESAARAELAAAEADRLRLSADLARYTKLFQAGFISQAELDQRRAAHKAAAARSAQAQAGLRVRSNQAEYAELRAGTDGVVTGVEAEVGQVVAAGQIVLRVASSSAKEVAFSIPEGRLDAVREHGNATVTLWTGGPVLQATVTEIAASADPATRVFAARARLQDPPESVQYGMTATVRFAVPMARPMHRVPLSALLRDGDGTAVWLLDPQSMSVHRRNVTIATVTDTEVVLEPSLPADAEVITAGVHLLREGQRVKRLNEPIVVHTPEPSTAAMLPLHGRLSGSGD